MKRNVRKVIWLALIVMVLAAAIAGVGCGKQPVANDDTAVNSTLTLGLESDCSTLDAIYSYDYSTTVVIQVTESLLYYDNDNQLQPGLVEDWQEVDPTTYVYRVRQNVNFSDGSPLTMEDVLYSLGRYTDTSLASELGWMYDNVESIEQSGEWEFTVKLQQPDALWKHVFATTGGHIQQKAFVEAAGENNGKPAGGVLGTGPYKLADWDPTSQMVLEYNENYWNREAEGEPDVKKIVVQFITEDATRLLATTSGQIDLNLAVPVEQVGEIEKSDKAELNIKTGQGLYYLAFNCKKAPFDDVNVRRAIASAIDAKTMQDTIIRESGTLTNYLSIPASLYTFEKATWETYEQKAEKYEYNLNRARQFLADSAYPDGFECEITVDERGVFNSVTLYMQQALKEIGITVKINKVSNDEAVTLQFGGGMDDKGVRPYDLLQCEWGADYPDPAGDLTPLYDSSGTGDGGSNASAYANPEVDKLLKAQAASSDDAERTRLMQEALDIINDEMPAYVWTHQNYLFGVNKRVSSGITELTGNWFWNIYFKNVTLSK